MLKTSFFMRHFRADKVEEEDNSHSIMLATAALLIEVSRSDSVRHDLEQNSILKCLESLYEFKDEELEELLSTAEDTVEDANDLHQFTRLLNEHFDFDARQQLLVQLWRVAYADGRIDKFEEHIIRRIAGLLHLDNRDFVRAKITARSLQPGARSAGRAGDV